MRLDQIPWKQPHGNDYWDYAVIGDNVHVARAKVEMALCDKGNYDIWAGHESWNRCPRKWANLDPLTAQAVLFEVTS